ncbi:MAG: DMT family transporter [Hyphomicrobiales bacterium]|nr:DMT family transporter [Hyphomicrobiales bacterium]
MTDPALLRRQRLTGIALMCGAVATFSCLDTTGKYLIGYMDPLQVVWARYFGAFLLALVFLNPINTPGMMVTRRPWLQIGRSALLLLSTALNFFALRYLQLDEALSILFATPFIVAIMSGPLLGEWVGWRRWTAIGVGFFGVLLVARPGFGGLHPAALLSLGSAVCYSLYSISTRFLARTDSSETTLFYTNLVGALAMLPIVAFVWTTPTSLFVVALMVLIGAFGSFGHYLLIRGHRLAPASTLAPFIYTQMVWTSTLGFLTFGDVPHYWTVVGGLIVVASGLYLLNRERKTGTAVTGGGVIPE